MKQPKISKMKIDEKGTLEIRKLMAKSQKIKITINIDSDTVSSLKTIASKSGVPYQVLINRILHQSLAEKKMEESRIDKVEKELARLKKKISA